MALCLASGSPRRRELLTALGYSFTAITTAIAEVPAAGESALDYVNRLAREKSEAAIAQQKPGDWILGSDTLIALDDKILEKPNDFEHFCWMMQQLSGRKHWVHTALALTEVSAAHDVAAQQQRCVTTEVSFKRLTDAEIMHYWHTGEPQGKAGGYAIQGFAERFVTRLNGSYSGVIGLPLYETEQLLRSVGFLPNWERVDEC